MNMKVFIRFVAIIRKLSAWELPAVNLSFSSQCQPAAPHKRKTKAGITLLSFERIDRLDTLPNIHCKTCCFIRYSF